MKTLNENETRVIFKKDNDIRVSDGSTIKGDIFACLLDVPANKYKVVVYAHIGQHGEADIDYCSGCKAVRPEEYKPLLEELKSIGYDLIIRKRFYHQ